MASINDQDTISRTQNRRVLVVDDNEKIHQDFRRVVSHFSGPSTTGEGKEFERGLLDNAPECEGQHILGVPGTATESVCKVQGPLFQIDSAFQGLDALEMAKKAELEGKPYALAIVDMRMPPGIDGLETIERLWEVSPRLHIVLSTAFSDDSWSEVIERVRTTEQFLVLKKPFEVIEAWQVISSQTKQWNLLAEAEEQIDQLNWVANYRHTSLERAHQEQIEVNRELVLAKAAAEEEAIIHKEIAEALRISESEIRAIIDASNDAFFILTQKGDITIWTKRAGEIFGWNSDDVLNKSCATTLFANRDASAVDQALDEIAAASMLRQRIEMIVCNKSLQTVPVEMSVSRTGDRDEPLFHVFAHDQSQRKCLQFQLEQAQRLESIGRLAAGVAHEINTPIQFVGDNIRFMGESFQLLASLAEQVEQVLPEIKDPTIREKMNSDLEEIRVRDVAHEIPDAISEALEGVEHVSSIVQSMKSFSHPGDAERRHENLNEIIENALAVSRNEWKNVARIETNLDANLPLVFCLGTELRQVLLNLIINATHAITKGGAPDGRISISSAHIASAEAVQVRVEDTGCGIPDDVREKVFDPFFTTKPVGVGTGQGLAITWDTIVNKHTGFIDLISTVDKGTTIEITLPIQASEM